MRSRRLLALAMLTVGPSAGAAELRAEPLAWIAFSSASRDAETTAVTREAVREVLDRSTELVDPDATRDALRTMRLRAPDSASTETLSRLASELGARWLLTVALHDAPSGPVPDLSLGARLYDGETGRLAVAGFAGLSGLDDRGLLGVGTIDHVAELAPRAASRLLEPLLEEAARERTSAAGSLPLPRLAVVPFTSTTRQDGFVVAAAATEALRARLLARGGTLAEPGCVREGLRRREVVHWGELTAGSREAIRRACGVERMVTGAVERWEVVGSGEAPEPIVAVALRLVDAADGQVLWAGSLEARGWGHPGWFGLRRVFSRGRLLEALMDRLTAGLHEFMRTGESPVFAESS